MDVDKKEYFCVLPPFVLYFGIPLYSNPIYIMATVTITVNKHIYWRYFAG